MGSSDSTRPQRGSSTWFPLLADPICKNIWNRDSEGAPAEGGTPHSHNAGFLFQSMFSFEFQPLKAGESFGKLTLHNSDLGYYFYELSLKALPALPEKPVYFQVVLGSSQSIFAKFINYTRQKTEYYCRVSAAGQEWDRNGTGKVQNLTAGWVLVAGEPVLSEPGTPASIIQYQPVPPESHRGLVEVSLSTIDSMHISNTGKLGGPECKQVLSCLHYSWTWQCGLDRHLCSHLKLQSMWPSLVLWTK